MCLSLAAVGALKCVGYATFGGAKTSVQKRASLLSSAKPKSSLPFLLSTSRPYAPNTLMSASPLSPLFPALAFASVKAKTYS